MRFAGLVTAVLFFVLGSGPVTADDKADLETLLAREIIGSELALTEVQKFCAGRIPPIPEPTSVAEWESFSSHLREETLARTVYRGEAARWRDKALNVEWLEVIAGGPGYRIKKLRYEALPGLWIVALLYEPEKISGKMPVFLNVNGHDANGKAADYKQLRCINQAKRGILALNIEWFGMGQFRTDGFAHGRMNQLDLCGTSGLAPFYLAMKRGLDVLLSLENADPKRVGVAGLSGGGWQTIIISALDTRVTLSNPVAGYSSFVTRNKNFSDLGDSEQTPVDLATTADYSHLTALLAPRATLLTYNLNDNCCFKADHALPPLLAAGRPFFRLYGQDDNLRSHVNSEPGDHNFQKDNREALYQMIGLHFFGGDRNFDPAEIRSDGEIKSADELQVEIPTPNADFHTLALDLMTPLPRVAAMPAEAKAIAAWQADQRVRLADVIKVKKYDVQAEPVSQETIAGIRTTFWRLKLGSDWTLPAVQLDPERLASSAPTNLLLGDAGRKSLAVEAHKLVKDGNRVFVVDPFYLGESRLGQRDYLFGLLVSAVGERPLGIQASQLMSLARWLNHDQKFGPVRVMADGPRTSLIAIVGAALEEESIAEVHLHGSYGSLKEIIEQNRSVNEAPELFTFGLLEAVDIKQLAALVAPRIVKFPEATDRVKSELGGLAGWYKLLGSEFDPVK